MRKRLLSNLLTMVIVLVILPATSISAAAADYTGTGTVSGTTTAVYGYQKAGSSLAKGATVFYAHKAAGDGITVGSYIVYNDELKKGTITWNDMGSGSYEVVFAPDSSTGLTVRGEARCWNAGPYTKPFLNDDGSITVVTGGTAPNYSTKYLSRDTTSWTSTYGLCASNLYYYKTTPVSYSLNHITATMTPMRFLKDTISKSDLTGLGVKAVYISGENNITYSANNNDIDFYIDTPGNKTLHSGTNKITITFGGKTFDLYAEKLDEPANVSLTSTAAGPVSYGTTVTLTAPSSAVSGVSYNYEWYKNGVKLSGTSSTLTLSNVADSGSYTVRIKASDGTWTTAQTESSAIMVSIGKVTPTISTKPTASAVTYGQMLYLSPLSGGVASVAGTFKWTNNTTKPAVSDSGKTAYSVTFTPSDTANYATITTDSTLIVNKKVITPIVGTVNNKEYNGTNAAIGTIAFSGAANGESPVATGTIAFTDVNAGANKSVNIKDVSLSGTWGDNYSLSVAELSNAHTTASITQKQVGLTWKGHAALVYSGSPVNVTAEATGLMGTDACTVTVTGGEETNAGNHTATATTLSNMNYKLPDASTQSYTISKAPITFVVTNNTHDYDAGVKSVTVTQTTSEVLKILQSGYAVSYKKGNSNVDYPKDNGIYDVFVTISNPNFKHLSTADSSFKVGTLTINSVAYPAANTMTWPTAANLTYGQKLSNSTLSGGDQTANGSYTWKTDTTIPTVVNSGYTVVFTPNDTNYATVEHTVSNTVSKATPTLSLPTASAITFGQKLSVSALTGGSASITYNGVSGTDVPGTFTWTAPDNMPSVSDSGKTDYALTFTPNDQDNYNVVTTGKIKLTVEPKEVGFTWSGHEALVYSGSPVNVTATATGMVGTDACTVTVTDGDKTDAGTHTATATTLSNANYKLTGVKTQSYTIAKAPVTFAVTNNNLEYNASVRSATVTQTASEVLKILQSGYAVSYKKGNSNVDSPKDNGTYDVFVTISNPNFKHLSTADSSFKVGTLTINSVTYPAANTMTWPTAANLTYGQKLSDSTLSGGDQTANGSYTWKDSASVPTVTNSGYTVVFTPTDTNYTPVEHTVSITVNKATPTLSLPTATAITYGQKLSVSALTGGSASITYNGVSGTDVPGTFTWTAPDNMPSVSDSGATDYDLTFTPTDSVNYNVVTTGKIKLTVNRKEVGLAWSGHESLVYSGSPVNVAATATGLVGADACTVTVTDGTESSAGTHTATATTLSNANYKLPDVKTQSYTIAKAPITFVVSGNSYTYDATAKTAVVTQTAGQTPSIAADKLIVSYQKSGDASGTADKTDAGSYDVMVTISDNNLKFEGQEESVRTFKVGTLTIGQKPITALWKNLHHAYDGTTRAAAFTLTGVESVDSGNVSAQISGGEQKNVGFHTVTAELTGTRAANYKLTNPAGTLVIQKSPVTFSVSGDMVKHDSVAKTATVNATANNVNFTGFTITYRKDGKAVEKPTDIGSYDIYAEFANTNYRHVDGTDGTARKIGVLNIFKDTAPATYTLSFAPGEGGFGSMTYLSNAQSGTARALPVCAFTKSGSAFAGWQYNSKTYQPGEVLEQPASNITLTALWLKSTFTISGVVNQDGTPTADAVVTLMLGSQQIAETVTESTGKYSFDNVAPGLYNLVVSKNGVTQTVKVEIISSNADNKNVILTEGKTNSVVSVASGTPDIVVGNLEKTFDKVGTVFTQADKDTVTGGGAVEIKFTAEAKAKDPANADQTTISAKASGTVELYLDMTLSKTVTAVGETAKTTPISVSDVLLESVVTLPASLQGKQIYKVYRLHDGKVDTLTTSPNSNGEYIAVSNDKTTLTIYTKNFSTYAIAYATYSGGETSVENSVVLAPSDHGKVTVLPDRPTHDNKVTITATPDKGYKVDTVTVTDGAGNKLKVVDNGNNTYNYIQPSGKVTITVTFKLADGKLAWNPFADVTKDSWFHDAVKYVYENNLMNGAETHAFEPDSSTTRGMIVTILFRMEDSPAGFEQAAFSDVAADSYYANAVTWGFKNGIVKGYDKRIYGPEDNITREQMASILYRYAEFKNYDLNKTASLEKFADGKETSDYAKKAMSWAVGNGLLAGKCDGILDPTGEATRAEAAAILMRFDAMFGKKA